MFTINSVPCSLLSLLNSPTLKQLNCWVAILFYSMKNATHFFQCVFYCIKLYHFFQRRFKLPLILTRASVVHRPWIWLAPGFFLFFFFIHSFNFPIPICEQHNTIDFKVFYLIFLREISICKVAAILYFIFFYPFICKMWLYYLRLTFYYCSFHILSPYKMHLKASCCCFTLVTGSPWCRCHWTNDNLNAYDIQITCYSNIQIV